MVRRHWVRGHFRGGDKTVGWAFIVCFIVGCLLFLIYDSLHDWRSASAAWWIAAGVMGACVALCIGAAIWWTISRWRKNIEAKEAKRHRPRYVGARAINNVHVNVTVSPDGSARAGSSTRRRPTAKPEAPESSSGNEDFPR
jgi:ABC-type nickel/cobalt efflux system permease component RcnA